MRLLRPALLAVLCIFVLVGLLFVPFHGDESTIIFMSRDWFRLAQQGDFAGVAFRSPPPNPEYAENQDLRLLNGVISKYLMGFGWSFVGDESALNRQWMWGADWESNLTQGHIPNDRLLMVTRFTSALCAVLSVIVIFQIGSHVVGAQAGLIGAVIYALLPIFLVNGRRAMFEGAFALTHALLIWASLIAASRYQRSRQGWGGWLLVGAATGLALSSKHTALLLAIPVFVGLIWIGRRSLGQTLIRAAAAGLIAGAIFMVLNPAWWNNPLGAAREVLRLRTSMLQIQIDLFGAFQNLSERLAAPFQFIFGSPQYFEDPRGWGQWVGEQIRVYEASGMAGIAPGAVTGLFLLLIGSALLVVRFREQPSPLIPLLGWISLFLYVSIVITNPLPWARYYLPLAQPFAVIAGAGGYALLRLSALLVGRTRTSTS